MFRRLTLLLALTGACLSIPTVSALATDEPAPPANVPAPISAPAPTPGGAPGACVDTSKPSVHISTPSAHVSRTRLLRGGARDLGCGTGGSGKVAQITVSLDRKSGKRCRFLSRSHRLARAKSCQKPTWLTAHGTTNWSFRLPKHLARGRYQLAVRAVDSSGNLAVTSKRALRLR